MYRDRVNQQIIREFKRYDGNNDGLISYEEFCGFMKNDETFAENGEDFNKLMFWLIDVDHNGMIDKEEFTRYKLIRKQVISNSPESYYKFIFKLIDVDKNGFIDYEEFDNYCKALEDYSQQKAIRYFNQLDVNEDGYISLEEFINAMVDDD